MSQISFKNSFEESGFPYFRQSMEGCKLILAKNQCFGHHFTTVKIIKANLIGFAVFSLSIMTR
jgi:hypothetical protein